MPSNVSLVVGYVPANLTGTGPICLRGVLAELSELETARSGQPMRTGTLMDAEGYAVPIVFLGENADVGEGGIYVWNAVLADAADESAHGKKALVYDEAFVHVVASVKAEEVEQRDI